MLLLSSSLQSSIPDSGLSTAMLSVGSEMGWEASLQSVERRGWNGGEWWGKKVVEPHRGE